MPSKGPSSGKREASARPQRSLWSQCSAVSSPCCSWPPSSPPRLGTGIPPRPHAPSTAATTRSPTSTMTTGTAAGAPSTIPITSTTTTTATITATRSSGCFPRNWPRRRISSSRASTTTTITTMITTTTTSTAISSQSQHPWVRIFTCSVYFLRNVRFLGVLRHDTTDNFGDLAGVWLRAMGCSLLVSMASLVCLILLPVILFQGKPSKAVVDALAVFGAGAMLGDSFLHQLPHAFGGGHSHSHNHEDHDHAHEQSHAHSLKDLSVGLSILFGIVLFFIVEKIVRYVEDNSQRGGHSHGHHHHHHKRQDISDKAKSGHIKSDDEGKDTDQVQQNSLHDGATRKMIDAENEQESNATKEAVLGSQRSGLDVVPGATDREPINSETNPAPGKTLSSEDPSVSNSNLVFGYLNLFSDGVHNFTDGMALGSAFLLHGSVGGWSRTLFLLAHELPQEIGDFGILVRSGFTVTKALFFNFLSALVALGGTALALSLGTDPGHSSLIEGFTAGGFIYIAVAGVLPQMHDQKTTLSNSMCQLIFLTMGMLVALGISLVE
ncbi:hypothetical protein VPH35_043312 [Triticum aestivum]